MLNSATKHVINPTRGENFGQIESVKWVSLQRASTIISYRESTPYSTHLKNYRPTTNRVTPTAIFASTNVD